jgi:hypothetical protein
VGAIHVDLSNWPLVIFTAEGDLTAPALDAHFREYRALLARKLPYTLLVDATKVNSGDAHVRKLYSEFLSSNAYHLKQYCKGMALIVKSSIIRGAFTALLWLAPLPFPHKVYEDINEARRWLEGCARAP